jgi:hypothetical protein
MLVVVWIWNGGRRIARGKRLLDRAVESGLAVPRFLVDGVLLVASVHSRHICPPSSAHDE